MDHQITTEGQLRKLIGGPVHELVVAKSTRVFPQSIKRYIEMSPFAVIATHAANGSTDVRTP
jgi:predicted pyridoxine 5'-phosphate oxidase superfamily flavin-nucleotide-binding protein